MSSWPSQRLANVGTSEKRWTKWQRCMSSFSTGHTPVLHPVLRQRESLFWQVGFRMFLNTTAAVTNWNAEGTECSLVRPAHVTLDSKQRAAVLHHVKFGTHADPGGQPADRLCGAARGLPEPDILQCLVRRHPRRPGAGAPQSSAVPFSFKAHMTVFLRGMSAMHCTSSRS